MAELEVPVVVRMTEQMRDQVKEQAEHEERSMAQIIRRAVRAYLAGGAGDGGFAAS